MRLNPYKLRNTDDFINVTIFSVALPEHYNYCCNVFDQQWHLTGQIQILAIHFFKISVGNLHGL